MQTAKLGGYSDDCANVQVNGEDSGWSEYSDKRLVITLPDGEEIVAELVLNYSWDVHFTIPDSCQVKAQQKNYGDKDWHE